MEFTNVHVSCMGGACDMFLCQRNLILALKDTTMSKQALDSEKVRHGLRDILLGPAQLYEALRSRGEGPQASI